MKTIFAVIELGVVVNIIRLDDLSLIPIFRKDDLVDITNLDPQPQLGWTYDGRDFQEVDAPIEKKDVSKEEQSVKITDDKTLGLPRMKKPNRDAIKAEEGMAIYNLDIKRIEYFNGIQWVAL